jgi:4-amino-4-deoxy-L-arabinose transferase-like glycosyltransferase
MVDGQPSIINLQLLLRRSVVFFLIFFCGAWLGGFVYYTAFGYVPRSHTLAWRAQWIGADESASQIYARKTFYLSRPLRNAFLQVMATDSFSLYVNSRLVGEQSNISFYAAGVFDLTSLLTPGKNVIAIAVARETYPGAPQVVAEGEWEDWSGHRGTWRTDDSWRVATTEERQRSLWWWRDKQFDESGWRHARSLGKPKPTERGRVTVLPALFQQPSRARWICRRDSDARALRFRQTLHLPHRPRECWLGVATGQAFKLLVNDTVVASGDALSTEPTDSFVMNFYDVSALVHKGSNAIQATTIGETWQRGLMVEGVAVLPSGNLQRFGSDETWESAPLASDVRGAWRPAVVMATVPSYARNVLQRRESDIQLSDAAVWRLRIPAILFMACGGLLLLLLSWGVGRRANDETALRLTPYALRPTEFDALCHGLVTLFLIFVFLLRYDVRLDLAFPFQGKFILIALALLAAAKLLPSIGRGAWGVGRGANDENALRLTPHALRLTPYVLRLTRWTLLVVLVAVGFTLRIRDVSRDALIPDEITQALQALSILQHGYPSLSFSDTMEERSVLASLLGAYVEAASIALFGKSEFAARFPQVLLGTLMILLVYRMGRVMCDERVGLFAALLYALSPWAIVSSRLARYPQPLQLTTLLAVYFLYQALKGEGVSRRAAAWFAVSVIAAYFIWEAAVLMLVPLFVAALFLRGGRWDWLREPATWASLGAIALVMVVFRLWRMMLNPFIYVVGTNLGQTSLGIQAWQPGFDLFVYWDNFLLLENQVVLTVVAGCGWLLTARHKVITFLVIVLAGELLVKTLLLPVATVRYTYDLLPFLMLLASAVLFRLKDEHLPVVAMPSPLTRGAAALLTAGALAAVALTSAPSPLKLYNLPGSHPASQARLGVYRDPNFQSAGAYLKARALPGDLIVATHPQAAYFYYGRCDYFPETSLRISLIYSERLQQPVHRTVGCSVIYTLDQLKQVLAQNRRVWFLVKKDRFDASPLEDLCNAEFVNYFLSATRCVYEQRGARVYVWEK